MFGYAFNGAGGLYDSGTLVKGLFAYFWDSKSRRKIATVV